MNASFQKWMNLVEDPIPSIYSLWVQGNASFKGGDFELSKKYEQLIYLLHNSVVYSECSLGKGVLFAYGEIGVVVHKNAILEAEVMVGQGCTIGGGGTYRTDTENKRHYTPYIKKRTYIAAGARVLGGIELGEYSIVGTNCVLRHDLEPFSVAVGMKGEVINKINIDNCLKYKGMFGFSKFMPNDEYIEYMRGELALLS